ncbi:uncharacterized protein LOC126995004 [Eriocheir sinensis]|uniref:uncharacterized protein LOC126995004 n=1 Tax=Eriocheir sinensis TaxID=95602 RepID=UPI0021CA3B63|nr:uncharacterized protein LOC126995004 [Eriocheir sinensis]
METAWLNRVVSGDPRVTYHPTITKLYIELHMVSVVIHRYHQVPPGGSGDVGEHVLGEPRANAHRSCGGVRESLHTHAAEAFLEPQAVMRASLSPSTMASSTQR